MITNDCYLLSLLHICLLYRVFGLCWAQNLNQNLDNIFARPKRPANAILNNILRRPKRPANQFVPRLYGFKIHPLAYQIQQQAAANFKVILLIEYGLFCIEYGLFCTCILMKSTIFRNYSENEIKKYIHLYII